MTDRIRMHLDENVDPDVAHALRRHGIDVSTTQEVGLRTKNDAAQFDFIRREDRVIVTMTPTFFRSPTQRVITQASFTAIRPPGRLVTSFVA